MAFSQKIYIHLIKKNSEKGLDIISNTSSDEKQK